VTFLEPKQLNISQDNLPPAHITILTLITQGESIKVHMMVEFILEMPVSITYVYKINLLKVINSMQDIWLLHNLSIQSWPKVNMLDSKYRKVIDMLLKWGKAFNIKVSLKFITIKMHNTCHRNNKFLHYNNLIKDNFCHSDQ